MDTAIRAAGTARAWQQGTRLGRLIAEHQLPRPAKVSTWNVPRPGTGQTRIEARMAAPADLFALAVAEDAELQACAADEGQAQAYVSLGPIRQQITAFWAGPLSTVESGS